MEKRIAQIIKEEIESLLKEGDYVEFLQDKPGEVEFDLGGKKWKYVWAKYPNGKRDVGVYSPSEVLVYSYDWLQDNYINKKTLKEDKDGNYMSPQNLKNIMQAAEFLLTQIDADSEIDDWVEDKISKVAENMRALEAFYRK